MSVLFTVNNGPVCGMSNMNAQLFLNYFGLSSEDDGSGVVQASELLEKLNTADPAAIAAHHLNYSKITEKEIAQYLSLLTEMATSAAKDQDGFNWIDWS